MVIDIRDEAGGVRVLTLNRPPAHAINPELLDELSRCCDEAARDDAVRAVVVSGSGKFFSGGLDLKEITAAMASSRHAFSFGGADGVFALWTLPKPTVAMVNGHAIAGGCILALACDVRIAADGPGKIGLNEVAIGLAFPVGAFEIARLALTNRQARRVLLEAGTYPPATALELGLVDEVVSSERLEQVCLERARQLGSHSCAAYAHTKRALQREAVERVRGETTTQLKELTDIWTSKEAAAVLMAQIAGMGGRRNK